MTSKPPLRIDVIRVRDLERFLQEYIARGETQILPISRERATAQARNPYAGTEDVGLLVGYDGDRCVAYLGLMPGVLQLGNSTRKIHWFSGWYVDPAYRHTSIGSLLLLKAFSLKYDLFMTGLSQDSEALLRALRLPELGPLTYCHFELDYAIRVATSPLRVARRLLRSKAYQSRWLDEAIDRCSAWLSLLKTPLYWRLEREADRALDGVECEPVEGVTELPDGAFDNAANGAEAKFYRGAEGIDWMLRYKWVPEGPPAEGDARYRFLARQDSFDFAAIKVSRAADGEYLGLVVLSIGTHKGHTVVKLLDSVFTDGDHPRRLWGVGLRYAARVKADRLDLPASVRPFVSSVLLWFVHQQTRRYFFRLRNNDDEVSRSLGRLRLNLHDGDQAFA